MKLNFVLALASIFASKVNGSWFLNQQLGRDVEKLTGHHQSQSNETRMLIERMKCTCICEIGSTGQLETYYANHEKGCYDESIKPAGCTAVVKFSCEGEFNWVLLLYFVFLIIGITAVYLVCKKVSRKKNVPLSGQQTTVTNTSRLLSDTLLEHVQQYDHNEHHDDHHEHQKIPSLSAIEPGSHPSNPSDALDLDFEATSHKFQKKTPSSQPFTLKEFSITPKSFNQFSISPKSFNQHGSYSKDRLMHN